MTLVMEVGFAVLILRICSYALQCLPSPRYTLNILISYQCSTCDEIANNLAAISSASDDWGSLIRIQHVAFFGLRCQMGGRDALCNALSVQFEWRTVLVFTVRPRTHDRGGTKWRRRWRVERSANFISAILRSPANSIAWFFSADSETGHR